MPICIYEGYQYVLAWEEEESIPDLIGTPSTEGMIVTTGSMDSWPSDRIFVAEERTEYKVQTVEDPTIMWLSIPSIGVEEGVVDGTSSSALKQGPGLSEYSQMPGEGNRNVIIAGHRIGRHAAFRVFKNLHKIKDKDRIYLTYKGKRYCYRYRETCITTPSDISILYLQGYSCVTLLSCNPIGDNYERIIVRAELEDIQEIE